MKKIYLSGKISGLDEVEVKMKFRMAEKLLHRAGIETVNPYEIGLPDEARWLAEGLDDKERWTRHMERDLDLLRGSSGIYMLDNWWYSTGAIIEIKEALACGLPVFGDITDADFLWLQKESE